MANTDLALPAVYSGLLNTQLTELYWTIGQQVRETPEAQEWGSTVSKRLSEDLRREFLDMKGLSAPKHQIQDLV